MTCNNCAFIRVVFFCELYFKEMCGSAETTQKSKRSRSTRLVSDRMSESQETTQKSKRSRSALYSYSQGYCLETTQKSKRSRSLDSHIIQITDCETTQKSKRSRSSAEPSNLKVTSKQLRRVSGVNNYHKILTIII